MPMRSAEAKKPLSRSWIVSAAALGATALVTTSAYAAGFSLDDDDAVLITSDGTIYSVDLTNAALTAGATLSGDALGDIVALEANPTTDTVFALDADTDPSLASIATSTGASTYIEDDYTNQEIPDGIARHDDGTVYLTHMPAGQATWHISTLDLATGVYTDSQETDSTGTNTRVHALATVDTTVYAFVTGGEDTVYSIDPATGTLTQVRASTGTLTGETVLAADTTADGTIYILGVDGSDNATLYTTDPAGATTSIGAITLGAGVTVANFAIGTLLDSERTSDDSEESDSDESDSDRDDSTTPEPAPVPPPVPPPAPAPAPTPEPAPEPDTDERQDHVGSEQEEPEPVPEPVPEAEVLVLPEPEQPGDPALITQPWVVVVMALAVLAVFSVVFGVVLRRERKLGANR